jgi:hypothetical protein
MHPSLRWFRVDFARFAVFGTLTCTLLLTGCALGTAAFPDTPEPQTQVRVGTIQGSNYGGHAPIVGAHVFVLQATTGGYGAKVTSLLSANETTTDYYGSVYTTALDTTTGSPTYGMYYITTDARGDYNISGDYTCTAGDPVFLYASGGNPETNPTAGFTVNVTGATGTVDANNKTLITFSTTGNQLLYQGETINFATFNNGGVYNAFSGTTQVVSPINLTTSTFAVELGSNIGAVGQLSFNTTVSQYMPIVSNPAIVNMALLGNCPSAYTITSATGIDDANGKLLVIFTTSGNAQLYAGEQVTFSGVTGAYGAFNGTTQTISSQYLTSTTFAVELGPYGGSPGNGAISGTVTPTQLNFGANSPSPISFVYMNEVSTVAAAYALAPFAVTTTNNDALHIGTSSTNLQGLQNAVLNANNLYDIQGSVQGSGGDGETHIARAVTPTNSGGTVPQTLINTLGNLLANCVDSANTYNAATASSGTASAQCSALFSNATSDGTTSGTQPNDTATAAINIAHHPAGEPSGNTTFMSGLFNSITGNQPFQPTLSTAPNDFTIGISYTGSGLNAPTGVAIDGSGDAWITGTGAVVELGPAGTALSGSSGYATVAGQSGRGPAIDLNGNLWFAQNNSVEFEMSSSGTLTSGTSGYSTGSTSCPNPPTPVNTAIDGSGNVWVTNYYGDYQGETVTELSPAGAIQQEINTYANTGCPLNGAGSTAATVRNAYGIALDGSGNMWISSQSSENAAAIPTSTTTGAYTAYNNSNPAVTTSGARNLAIDQSGNVWMPDYYSPAAVAGAGTSITVFTPSTATASGTAHADNVSYSQFSGGGLLGPEAIAVDGANNIWVSGPNDYISEFSNSGTALTPPTTCSTSPCTSGGYAGGFTAAGGLGLAIDGSGNVWVTEPSANAVVQMIGVATPVLTPLVAAAQTGTPAAKP